MFFMICPFPFYLLAPDLSDSVPYQHQGSVKLAQTAVGICAVLWVTCVVLRGALVLSHCSISLQMSSCSWKFFSLWLTRQSVVAVPL